MTHPHDAYAPAGRAGSARPAEPVDALTLCWAGLMAGAAERRAHEVTRIFFYALLVLLCRPPLLRWAEIEEAA